MRASHAIALLSFLLACDETQGTSSSGGAGSTSGPGSTASATASSATAASSTSSASSGEGGSGGAAACVSGLEQPTAACTTCQDAHWCLTATAAAIDPGVWTRSAATICREANCAAECGVPEPECGGIVPTPASCTDDLYASCCAEVTACAESDACTALIYICIDDRGLAPGSAGFMACAMEFPGGDALFADLDTCFAGVTCT
jgi:hypothetical protein